MTEFEEGKFLVLKWSDIEKLSITNRGMVYAIIEKIGKLRCREGRDPDPKYYVCNRDEPYSMDVLNMILIGEDKKERNDGV